MAATAYLYPMSTPSVTPSSTQQPRPTLRRATYVHVSDLTSAYNIDHARLEQELSRVKAGRELLDESIVGASTHGRQAKKPREDPGEESSTAADLETVMPQKRLQPPRGGYNLCVRVGKVNVVVDKKRVDQSRVRLAEVEVGDETGIVSLRARDDQIDMLEEVSQRDGAVVLRNCSLELYQGRHIRLAVTKWGKLSTYPDDVASTPPPPSKMNVDRNFSLIDLSIVASEMVDISPSSESRYGSRQSKGSTDNDQGSGSGAGSAKPQSSRGSQPSTPKHQQPQSSKRSSKSGERRQSRGKTPPGGPMSVHYGGIKPDSRQQQQSGQMMYHTVPGYPSYEQTMGLRQYPHSYTHATRQDVSAQHMMLQQQFELQHRQLQQMYGQEHHRQGHQVQQAPQMMIRPMESFDTSSYAGDASDQHQHPLMSGASPLLMPMGMSPAQSMTQPSQEHYASPTFDSRSAPSDRSNPRASGTMSPYTIGKMNPDASTYTPSYLSAAQGHPSTQQSTQNPAQFAYDYSHSQAGQYPPPTGQYPGFYTPAGIAPGAAYPISQGAPSSDPSAKRRHTSSVASPGTTDSNQSGKENATSKK